MAKTPLEIALEKKELARKAKIKKRKTEYQRHYMKKWQRERREKQKLEELSKEQKHNKIQKEREQLEILKANGFDESELDSEFNKILIKKQKEAKKLERKSIRDRASKISKAANFLEEYNEFIEYSDGLNVIKKDIIDRVFTNQIYSYHTPAELKEKIAITDDERYKVHQEMLAFSKLHLFHKNDMIPSELETHDCSFIFIGHTRFKKKKSAVFLIKLNHEKIHYSVFDEFFNFKECYSNLVIIPQDYKKNIRDFDNLETEEGMRNLMNFLRIKNFYPYKKEYILNPIDVNIKNIDGKLICHLSSFTKIVYSFSFTNYKTVFNRIEHVLSEINNIPFNLLDPELMEGCEVGILQTNGYFEGNLRAFLKVNPEKPWNISIIPNYKFAYFNGDEPSKYELNRLKKSWIEMFKRNIFSRVKDLSEIAIKLQENKLNEFIESEILNIGDLFNDNIEDTIVFWKNNRLRQEQLQFFTLFNSSKY